MKFEFFEKFTTWGSSGVFEPPMARWKRLEVNFPKIKNLAVTNSIFRIPALRPEVQGGVASAAGITTFQDSRVNQPRDFSICFAYILEEQITRFSELFGDFLSDFLRLRTEFLKIGFR